MITSGSLHEHLYRELFLPGEQNQHRSSLTFTQKEKDRAKGKPHQPGGTWEHDSSSPSVSFPCSHDF